MLGPEHPRNTGMGGLSPCSNRGVQIPGGGVGGGGGGGKSEIHQRDAPKAEGAAVLSPPLPPCLRFYRVSSAPVFGLGDCSSFPHIAAFFFFS